MRIEPLFQLIQPGPQGALLAKKQNGEWDLEQLYELEILPKYKDLSQDHRNENKWYMV